MTKFAKECRAISAAAARIQTFWRRFVKFTPARSALQHGNFTRRKKTMRPFKYSKAADAAAATKMVSDNKAASYLAGGTNILDLMKEDVARPAELIDISRLNLTQIKNAKNGISIGALAKNTDTANHPLVRQNYPLLSQAILAGASGQIRNMATNGGNLMQRTRCSY